MKPSNAPIKLDDVRRSVLEKFASLFEGQTRANLFAENISQLVYDINRELAQNMQKSRLQLADPNFDETLKAKISDRLQRGLTRTARLDSSLKLLFDDRQKQWDKNENHLKQIMLEFNGTADKLAGTLIEKDLLERQSAVLESIILSHEKISQWKVFVQEILSSFHAIFPFNFFFIAFAEENGLSLFVYYLGNYSEEVKANVRKKLAHDMILQLNLPADAPLDIEEFHIPATDQCDSVEEIKMISVKVPELEMVNLAGLLGVAYGSIQELTAQEASVVRSILAVMVMVVGSSKALSRTMAELEYYSTHDPLTGLHNRRYFNDMVDYELGRSERHGHEFAILMLDLDDFKDINDTYGHPCGDAVLKQVAETMTSTMRKGDLATRIGGDEFAIVLTETGKEGASLVAEKLRATLHDVAYEGSEGKNFHISTSIGLVSYPQDAKTVTDLMAGVDIGLYRAKAMGKNSVCTLDEVGEKIQASRIIRDHAEELRASLRNDLIVPYFQPIFDCQSKKIFAYEALARLVRPGGETVSAGMFIETIEKYGLGRELDRVMIQKSFAAMKGAIDEGHEDMRLFINLSAQEIQGRGVLAYAEQLCVDLNIPPNAVVFEILERDAIGDMTHMRKFLTDLRKKGFSFALDDFGSGYNSFHYLRELSFDFVKMDGAFVRNILNSKIDYALVRNLSRLCQDLGILMVAEFVESEEVLHALRDMGIEYAQGFHLGLPVSRMK